MSTAESGLPGAFAALVASHSKTLAGLCRSVLKDEHQGKDVAQETLFKLWQAMRSGRAPKSPGPWLRTVAVRRCLDLMRQRESQAELGFDETHTAPSPASRPDESASLHELEERLESALSTLSETQRQVFSLRHFAGVPLSEIASATGLSHSTVKTHFARACAKLQSSLRPFAE